MHPMVERRFVDVADWHKVLTRDLKIALPALKKVLDGNGGLPQGCPSRAVAAQRLLDTVGRDLDEFLYAYGEMTTLIDSLYGSASTPLAPPRAERPA
jgi:hypothetical protein